jgi:hypothetical protein
LQGVAGPKGDTGPTGPLGGLLDGSVDAAKLADNAVTSAKVAADTLTAADIATGAVETTEILDSTITIADLAQSVWASNAHATGTLAARPPAGASNDGFFYLATDDAGGTLYRSNGSSWVKVAPGVSSALPESFTLHDGDLYWWNQPAAVTELAGNTLYRTKYDLSNATQARFTVSVATAGAPTAKLSVQYSTDESSWSYLDGATGPSVNINSTGTKVSSYATLVSGARGDVFLRIVGEGGNATADPYLGLIQVTAKP